MFRACCRRSSYDVHEAPETGMFARYKDGIILEIDAMAETAADFLDACKIIAK